MIKQYYNNIDSFLEKEEQDIEFTLDIKDS